MNNQDIRDMTLAEIERELGYKINLVDSKKVYVDSIRAGDLFKTLDGKEWIMLDNTENYVKALFNGQYEVSRWRKPNTPTNRTFFENDYNQSVAAAICNKLKTVMQNNEVNTIQCFKTTIRNLDGRAYYRAVMAAVRLLTYEEACHYMGILSEHRLGRDWWLATARTMNARGEDDEKIVCVDESRKHVTIGLQDCWQELAIRPCAFFAPETIVSI